MSSGGDDDGQQQNLGNESKDADFGMVLMRFTLQPISVSSDQPLIPPCYFAGRISAVVSFTWSSLKVLPSLREKKDELLLRELVRRWSNHKDMRLEKVQKNTIQYTLQKQ